MIKFIAAVLGVIALVMIFTGAGIIPGLILLFIAGRMIEMDNGDY